jgi:hypothetical protein
MTTTVLGIDLAKNVFQLHGVDDQGKVVMRKQLTRQNLHMGVVKAPVCNSWDGIHFLSHILTNFAQLRH